MKKVLLVEDNKGMQHIVRSAIEDICDLASVETAADAQVKIENNVFDLLILDVSLPDQSGFKFCADVLSQDRYKNVPVIFLTGDNELTSKLHGFELGAHDYITKPFEPAELKARVSGILRRAHSAVKEVHVNGYRVDLKLQKVFEKDTEGGEKPLPLTPIEFKLLNHFLQNENKVYSRQQLLDLFWGDSVYVSKHTVDTHISSLRKKMGDSAGLLRSIFKQGYLFANPLKKPAAAMERREKNPPPSM